MKSATTLAVLAALIGFGAVFGFWMGARGRWWGAAILLGVLAFGFSVAMTIGGQIGGIKGANATLSVIVFGGPVWIGIAAGTLVGHMRQRPPR